MKVNYAPFVGRMIDKYEGGYGWDKGDHGGPTKYGITCYDYAWYLGQKMDSMTRWAPLVKAMKRSEAEEIYRRRYAVPVKFDELRSGPDCVIMDYGVNSGVSRPIRVACALLKQPASGIMTPALLAAINKADPSWFIRSMNEERLHFMHQIRGGSAWKTFGKGWGARVQDLSTYCLALAVGAAPPVARTNPSDATPKATHDDPALNKKAGGGSAGSVVAWITSGSFAGIPIWALVTGVVVIGLGAVAYLTWKNYKAALANEIVVLPPGVVPQGA